MRDRRRVGHCSVGLLFLALCAATPAGAQFPGVRPTSPAAPPPPPPVRKVVEDDGVSAYVITDLGTLPDAAVASSIPPGTPLAWTHWQPDSVGGINSKGDIALTFTRTAGGKRAGVYAAETGKITVLPLPPGSSEGETRAFGLGDDGRVLGETNSAGSATGRFHPVSWKGSTVSNLSEQKDENGRPSESDQVRAFALSPDGRYAAGQIFLNCVGSTAACWYDGALHHTDPLAQGEFQSWGVNNAGQVVGDGPAVGDEAHSILSRAAFLWGSGSMDRLEAALPEVDCGARAVNAGGVVVGWSNTQDVMVVHRTDVHAVLWRDGRIQDLGTLGGPVSTATAINDAGQVVGYAASGPADVGQPFLWEKDKMRALGTLIPPNTGWSLGEAQINNGDEGFLVINARGQIAGIGQRDAETRAFLLTPRALVPKK